MSRYIHLKLNTKIAICVVTCPEVFITAWL